MNAAQPTTLALIAVQAAACIIFPALTIAAPDSGEVIGDLKVGGIHFSVDGNVVRQLSDLSSPWAISNTNISFTTPGGKVGIGVLDPKVSLDVYGDAQLTGNLLLPASTPTTGMIKSGPYTLLHTTGANNLFIGKNAGNISTTGQGGNTATGSEALMRNSTGVNNTASGYGALTSNTSGNGNTAIGMWSLVNNSQGTTNTGIGEVTLYNNTLGQSNTAVGDSALKGNTTGHYNTAVGYYAGHTGTSANASSTGSSNTFIGSNSGPGSPAQLTNATAIGANALVNQDNSLVLGAPGVKVGIGTPAPTAELEVAGTVKAANYTGDGSTLSNIWKTTGNAVTNPAVNFLGTTDNQPFEIRVNSTRALRVEPNATSPNITFGSSANVAGGVGVYGATVSGGGGATANCYNPLTAVYDKPCTNIASSIFATVGGGSANTASGISTTVGGGLSNTASTLYATVGGGIGNTSSFFYTTISGGLTNIASGQEATVGGGSSNVASGFEATVGGGSANTASGTGATVSGGNSNLASGQNSFAAGSRAKTQTSGLTPIIHDGVFIFSDSNAFDFNSTAAKEFAVRATGGVRFVTAIDSAGALTKTTTIDGTGNVNIDPLGSVNFGSNTRQMINLWSNEYAIGVQAFTEYFRTAGDYAWYNKGVHDNNAGAAGAGGTTMMKLTATGLTVTGTVSPSSDRNLKENFEEVDSSQILEKVANLPVQQWNYRDDEGKTLHIGPMAQDFYAAFKVGQDDKHIATVDADGIALAAIKALKAENGLLKSDIEVLKERLERIEKLVAGLK